MSTVPAITADEQFVDIYTAHRVRIEAYIVTRLPRPDRQLAEDIAAEAFTSLWRHLQAGHAVDYPAALLRTIAARRVYDHYRQARNVRETPSDAQGWQFTNSNLTPAASGACELVRSGFRTATIGGAR